MLSNVIEMTGAMHNYTQDSLSNLFSMFYEKMEDHSTYAFGGGGKRKGGGREFGTHVHTHSKFLWGTPTSYASSRKAVDTSRWRIY